MGYRAQIIAIAAVVSACTPILGLGDYRACEGVECDGGTNDATDGAPAGFCDSTASSKCPTAGLAQCVAFDDGTLGGWQQYTQDSATLAVDTISCRGSRSLHVHVANTSAAAPRGDVYETSTLAGAQVPVWIRAYVYEPAGSIGASVFLYAAQATGAGSIGVGASGGFVYASNAVAGTEHVSKTPIAFDRWNCLEVEIGLGATSVWLDDLPVSDLTLTESTTPTPALKLIAAGLLAISSPPSDVWVDEVAVSTTGPIGCKN